MNIYFGKIKDTDLERNNDLNKFVSKKQPNVIIRFINIMQMTYQNVNTRVSVGSWYPDIQIILS